MSLELFEDKKWVERWCMIRHEHADAAYQRLVLMRSMLSGVAIGM